MEVFIRVFAQGLAAKIAVPFIGDGRDAADILRSLPPTNRDKKALITRTRY